MVDQFTLHFQSMEIPVKMENLKLCHRETGEAFDKYVLQFKALVSKIKETPELKEVVKICSMNLTAMSTQGTT